jgi:hypothetical protein
LKNLVLLALVLACLALPVTAQPCYNTGSGVTISVGVGTPNVYYQPGYYVNNGYYYQNSGYYYTNGNGCYNQGYYPSGYYYNNGYYPGYNPGPTYQYTNGCGQRVYYPSTGSYNRYNNGRYRGGVRVNVGYPVR